MGSTEVHIRPGDLSGLRLAIVASRYNPRVVEGLLAGAWRALRELKFPEERVQLWRTPGAFELPLLAQRLAQSRTCDALICLGAVIQGETRHFDYVCSGVTQGLMQAALSTQTPISFGILTTASEAQALARAGHDASNKGFEAALTAVEMVLLLKKLEN